MYWGTMVSKCTCHWKLWHVGSKHACPMHNQMYIMMHSSSTRTNHSARYGSQSDACSTHGSPWQDGGIILSSLLPGTKCNGFKLQGSVFLTISMIQQSFNRRKLSTHSCIRCSWPMTTVCNWATHQVQFKMKVVNRQRLNCTQDYNRHQQLASAYRSCSLNCWRRLISEKDDSLFSRHCIFRSSRVCLIAGDGASHASPNYRELQKPQNNPTLWAWDTNYITAALERAHGHIETPYKQLSIAANGSET